MNNFETIVIILVAASAIMSLVALILVATGRKKTVNEINDSADRRMGEMARFQEQQTDDLRETLRNDIASSQRDTVSHIGNSFKNYGELVTGSQEAQARQQSEKLAEINKTLADYTLGSEQKLENIRQSVTKQLGDLTQENSRQLEQMRNTVDEKLQKTLEDRIGQSFQLVNERLEQVYKGLGEMQNLASGVGDLKKVLSNVKTRGILGEVQLGSILEQILAPEQYEVNIATRPGHSERVEFAVRLPGGDDSDRPVYLPIDAKFPGDAYGHLREAYENGDQNEINAAAKQLETAIKTAAKDIKEKYVEPPYTTDFGIMFLPFEGLYAEVVNRGMLEVLQRDYRINIAGPTTMAALLNSLQMGFRTLAIQKHSSEVWDTLGAVKTEFEKFEGVLQKAQKNLTDAGKNLDTLIGTRSRLIRSKLKKVESLEDAKAVNILGTADLDEAMYTLEDDED